LEASKFPIAITIIY